MPGKPETMTPAEALELEAKLTGRPAPVATPASELPDVIRRMTELPKDRDGMTIVGAVPVGVVEFPPGSVVVQDARGMRYIRTPRGELRRCATKPRGGAHAHPPRKPRSLP